MSNKESIILKEVQTLFDFVPPDQLTRNITYLLNQYFINAPSEHLRGDTPELIQNVEFLLKFIHKARKEFIRVFLVKNVGYAFLVPNDKFIILKEVQKLFSFVPPDQLTKSITYLLTQYFINSPADDLPKNTSELVQDVEFLLKFIDKVGKN